MPESLTNDRKAPSPLDAAAEMRWALRPGVRFLNHGCFGARPEAVLAAQQQQRLRFESDPVHVLDRLRNDEIDAAAARVAAFVGAGDQQLGFVTNTTEGINAIVRARSWNAGDEILTTNHVYNAIRQTMLFLARQHGVIATEVDVPLPLARSDEITRHIMDAVTDQTRLVIIDHVTSPTAIVFPVHEIVAACAARGIDVIVDGAHAPGMLDLDVQSINAAYYVGNLHKWVCAPPGAAFICAAADRATELHPATISHFYREGLVEEFRWQGTRDISPWLTTPVAIDTLARVGWDAIRAQNHALATWVQSMLTEAWGVEAASPLDGSLLGSMATVALPPGIAERFGEVDALTRHLYEAHDIEVPTIEWGERWWIRPSCQIYNTAEDYMTLADAVASLRG